MRETLRKLAIPPVSGFIAFLIFTLVLVLVDRFLLPVPAPVFWGIVGVLAAAWVVLSGVWYWRRKRKNAAFAEEIAPEPDPTSDLIDSEGKALQSKFATAVKDLSKLRLKGKSGRSRYLYELPWYIFIGPPGAGKTEALRNCGLDFPLRRDGGDIDIEGGAGTRNCNWVFTNDAVFIDTAGRYTTQSSDKTVDTAAWHTFLDLLGRHRPREPINGVIVAISLKDLASASGDAVDEQAKAIRARLKELCDRMNARIPVYVVFTKADLLVGFNEFFQTLRPQEREQVWGTTLPLGEGRSDSETLRDNLDGFDHEFETLVDQLGEIQFRHMREEPDLSVRAKIFSFPSQFSSMKPVIARFMRGAFDPDSYSDPVLLRGFYFTSATQVGQPVDRLVESLARDFGIERQALPITSAVDGRSYFLADLLDKVVFPEAGLVGKTARTKKPLGRYAAIAACIALPLLVGAGLFVMHGHNQREAEKFAGSMRDYRASLTDVPVQVIEDSDPTPVLPALDILRAEVNRLDGVSPPLPFGLFVDRVPDLEARARQTYDDALDTLLRPRLLHLFEREISRNMDEQGALYGALKAYLLVGGAKRSNLVDNVDFLKRRVVLSLEDILTERTGRTTLANLVGADGETGHVDAWLAKGTLTPWWSEAEPDLNTDLVNRARNEIDIPVEDRVLESMIPEASALLPDWSLSARAGRSLTVALIDAKGGAPDKVVPALFTYRGFYEYFDVMAERTVAAIRAEEWVTAEGDDFRESTEEIVDRLEQAYYGRYIAEWRDVLEDLRVKPFSDANSANEVLTALVAYNASPLKRVLDEVVRQTALEEAPAGGIGGDSAATDAAQKEGTRIVGEALQRQGSIGRIADAFVGSRLSGRTSEGGGGAKPGAPVQRAFEDLHSFIEGGSLDTLLEQLQDFRREIVTLSANGDTRPLSTTSAALDLKAALSTVPDPVDSMLATMLEQADMTRSKGARARLDEIWKSTVYRRCVRSLHERYPFARSTDEVSLGELSAILGPGGLIADFFDDHLAILVDQETWQWRPAGLALGIAPEKLAFFQDAATIRRALFANGTSEPGFEQSVTAGALEAGVDSLQVVVGGSPLVFTPDDLKAKSVDWPGRERARGATLAVTTRLPDAARDLATDDAALPGAVPVAPVEQPEPASMSRSGSWGLFRLVDGAGYTKTSDRVGRIRAIVGGTLVTLELRTSSENPFALKSVMQRFRCPASL